MGEKTTAGTTAYGRFGDFYPFYLSQHANRVCRWLHWWLLTGLAAGYALFTYPPSKF
jgi:hypothetical protein